MKVATFSGVCSSLPEALLRRIMGVKSCQWTASGNEVRKWKIRLQTIQFILRLGIALHYASHLYFPFGELFISMF